MHTCLLEFAGGNTRKALLFALIARNAIWDSGTNNHNIHTFTLRIGDRRRHLVRHTNSRVDADLSAVAELFRVSNKAGPFSTDVEGVA